MSKLEYGLGYYLLLIVITYTADHFINWLPLHQFADALVPFGFIAFLLYFPVASLISYFKGDGWGM